MNKDLDLSRALDATVLGEGAHMTRDDGMCAMELVAFLAGERHTDHPDCACPVLTSYTIGLNDSMPEVWRQQLKPYLPLLIGSRDGRGAERAELLARRACTVFVPIALDAASLGERAEKLRAMVDAPLAELRAAAGAAGAAAAADAAARAAGAAAAAARAADAAAWASGAAAAAARASRRAAPWDTIGPLALRALDDAIAIGREERPAPAPEIAREVAWTARS